MFRLASLLLFIVGLLCSAQAQNTLTLTGAGGPRTSAEPPGLTFVTSTTNNSIGASAVTTFTAIATGNADPNKYIIAAIGARGAGTSPAFVSATICGVTATIHIDSGSVTPNDNYSVIVGAAVALGTTCTIVVTQNQNFGTFGDCSIGIYRKVGTGTNTASNTAATATATAAAPAWSLDVNIPTDATAIYVQTNRIGANAEWSGATQDASQSTNGGQTAFARSSTTGTPHTVTYPNAGLVADFRSVAGASWVIN